MAKAQIEAKCVLLDIEGTVSDVRFVYDVLFPFAKSEMRTFLRDNWSSARVQDAIRTVATDAGISDTDTWLGSSWQSNSATAIDRLAEHLDELMAKDSKSTGLKQLQGMVWQSGFETGTIQAELFEDVLPALQEWRDADLDIRIYSSGSILAQTMFFKHTTLGDLSSFFSSHYDTTIGGKKESASYTKIATDSRFSPNEIVFVSDIYEELVAAEQAGLQAVASIRPNNVPLSAKFTGLTITSFSQLKIVCGSCLPDT
jgi:enolase-phosphatase E1